MAKKDRNIRLVISEREAREIALALRLHSATARAKVRELSAVAPALTPESDERGRTDIAIRSWTRSASKSAAVAARLEHFARDAATGFQLGNPETRVL